MDRNQAKEFYPILQAFAKGRVIECRTKPNTVKGSDIPNDWTEMTEIEFWNNTEYRIKPEQKFRPFKDAEECWAEMEKHQPFGWVKDKVSDEYFNVYCISNDNEGKELLERMFKRCVFIDKNPFGVKDEEE